MMQKIRQSVSVSRWQRKLPVMIEAMFYDEDYVVALEHGLPRPPAKGLVLTGW